MLRFQRRQLKISLYPDLPTTNGHEVDFLIGDHTAIEVKSSKKITNKHLKGLKSLQEENVFSDYFLISQGKIEEKVDGIRILHWENFLKKLWNREFI